jgi:hypothetical protein
VDPRIFHHRTAEWLHYITFIDLVLDPQTVWGYPGILNPRQFRKWIIPVLDIPGWDSNWDSWIARSPESEKIACFNRFNKVTLWLCQQFAIEIYHRNSGFTHWKWWIFP